MNVELASASVLLVLYSVLSLNVSMARTRLRDGVIGADKVEHSVRIHGNASEYIPLFVAVFLYLSFIPTGLLVHSIVVFATASRICHAIGMLRIESISRRHPLRFIGAIGTYLSILMFGILFLVKALGD